MEATQTDIEYPQPDGQEDGTVDGIAGGIMDMLDNPDPNNAGVLEVKPAETSADNGKTTSTGGETTVESEGEKPGKYTIK